jgi:hypothetical protein
VGEVRFDENFDDEMRQKMRQVSQPAMLSKGRGIKDQGML